MTADVATVVREHAPFVWRVLRHQGVPEASLEDLAQEVFVIVLRRLRDFEGRSSLKTWLYGICRNVAAQARRTVGRRRETLTAEPPERATGESQTEAVARGDARLRLREALAALPVGTRMVFVLYEIEEMPMAEVAEAVGCNASTAYSRLYSARKRVRAAMDAAGWDLPLSALAEVGS